MSLQRIHQINAITLVVLGTWGYLEAPHALPFSLLPAFFGVLLLLCHRGLRAHRRGTAYLALMLTALAVGIVLLMLIGAAGRGDSRTVIRSVFMLFTSLAALLALVRGFGRDAFS